MAFTIKRLLNRNVLVVTRFNLEQCNPSLVKTQPIIARGLSAAPAPQVEEDAVIVERGNDDKGVIKLNRPRLLNAVNLAMIRKIYNQLRRWEMDADMKMVIIKSANDKAFCAGGDVKAMASERATNYGETVAREEYRMNNLIGCLSIPYVALIDGVCMGSGAGLSVHAPFRVVTERAIFAMPETAIGYFPDVGASHFLSRLPGRLGAYLGLTGFRLAGRDIFKAGIGTHFVPSDKLPFLEEELLRLQRCDILTIDGICSKYQEQWELEFKKEFGLKPFIGRINSAFQGETLEDIIENLKKDTSGFGKKTLETLHLRCPMSLKVALEMIRRGTGMTLPESLRMEFRIACRLMQRDDFYEGVRAVLIDKDQAPKWNPPRIEDITPEMVEKCFEKLPREKELHL